MIYSVYKNLELDQPKNHFTVGIYEDVTNSSLDFSEKYEDIISSSQKNQEDEYEDINHDYLCESCLCSLHKKWW